jgi:glycosyltransferase involved in cell wall biosynthesis
MLWRIRRWRASPLVLTVAQQLPHKRIERVLAAVAVYQQEYRPDAHLAVVGVERFHAYSRSLEQFASTVGLHNVHFLGRIGDAELASLFLRSQAFVTLSDHEGFCVPVIEAMAAGVPVVTSDRAALPGTVGDAGVVVEDPDDPMLVASMLDLVARNERVRGILAGRGIRRASAFDADASLHKYLDLLETEQLTPAWER